MVYENNIMIYVVKLHRQTPEYSSSVYLQYARYKW